jgi:hypothetical protein
MDRTKGRLAAECVNTSDWENMVKLFVAIARKGHEYKPGHALLKERLKERFRQAQSLLTKR